MTWLLGIIAGVVGVLAYIPYVRDILKRTTKPERASWIIWSLEYAALFAAQAAKGATDSLWLIGLQLLGVLVIAALSIRYGFGGFGKGKIVLLGCAILALIAWHFTNNASLAIIILVGIEMAAIVPTLIKTYRNPETETLSTWAIIGVAGLLALPAVASSELILYLYPASLVVINFGVVVAAKLGKRKRQTAPATAS
jgi:hypothetical protein